MADKDDSKKNPSGGPKTEEGKKNSSRNATTHGGCATQCLILKDESIDEYTQLRTEWLTEFEPESFSEKTLCEELIRAHWLMKRAQRRLVEAEFLIAGEDNLHPVDWTEENERKIGLMQRYKTSHERAFYRAWNALKQLGKDDLNEAMKLRKLCDENAHLKKKNRDLEDRLGPMEADKAAREPDAGDAVEARGVLGRARLMKVDGASASGAGRAAGALFGAGANDGKGRAESLFRGQQSKKKRKKVVTLEQWVEIETTPGSGTFTTTLYPSNEELILRGQKLWPAPTLVVRRLNFVGGVPRKYDWALEGYAGEVELLRKQGGCGLQRMEVDDWLEHTVLEAREGNGHLLPIDNLPRPQERGGCECAVCVENERRLEG